MRILLASLLSALMLGSASLPALLPEEPPSGGSSLSMVGSSSMVASGGPAESESLAESSPASVSSSASPTNSSTESTPANGPESIFTSQSTSVPSSVENEAPSSLASESSESSGQSQAPAADSLPEQDKDEVTALAAEEDTENTPVVLSDEYANLLATNQADSMMGFYGMERDPACASVAAVFPLDEYAAKTEDEAYTLLWDAMNAAFEAQAASGTEAAHCAFAEGVITIYTK